jgi:formylglycine-generating enzyme required for sulfatase activity
LYADLRAAGVVCWYAPEDMAIGNRIRKTIYTAIGRLDKLLIILSYNSIASEWVEGEVERAFERERRQKETILFPIRLDDAVMDTDEAWAGDIRRTRHIGDFIRWNEAEAYARALQRLLRDLSNCNDARSVRGGPASGDLPATAKGTTSLDEPDLVRVPAGPFLMGTSDGQIKDMLNRFDWAGEHQQRDWFKREQPAHEVTLPAFEIGRYPVTNVEYAAFVEATGRKTPTHWQKGHCPEALTDHPVVNVTWHDAQAFAAWLSGRTGDRYRLPTEAEWEKAARGQDGRLWPWGNEWDAKRPRVNCSLTGPGTTTPVGQYSPDGDSPYGCAEVAGNVWEWCATAWQDSYALPADDDSAGNALRVQRGGSWHSANPGGKMRCAFRNKYSADKRYFGLGFRVVRSSE